MIRGDSEREAAHLHVGAGRRGRRGGWGGPVLGVNTQRLAHPGEEDAVLKRRRGRRCRDGATSASRAEDVEGMFDLCTVSLKISYHVHIKYPNNSGVSVI